MAGRLSSSPGRPIGVDAGFSLMEAIVATVIAVVAALGLAYAFSIGRGNVTRFEAARAADARAQGRMEYLSMLMQNRPTSDDLTLGTHPASPIEFKFHDRPVGTEYWIVEPAPASVPPGIRARMSQVTVEVTWMFGGQPDTARYARLFGR